MVTDKLSKLITGTDMDGEWPYEVTFPDGTVRYALGKSPKDAAAKVCHAKRCSKDAVIRALMEAVKK